MAGRLREEVFTRQSLGGAIREGDYPGIVLRLDDQGLSGPGDAHIVEAMV